MAKTKATPKAPAAQVPTVRVRLVVTEDEQEHLRVMAARRKIRATGDYVRELIRADMEREAKR